MCHLAAPHCILPSSVFGLISVLPFLSPPPPQNGSLMCRFAAPTCWNFYHIIRFAKDFCSNEDQEAHLCRSWEGCRKQARPH